MQHKKKKRIRNLSEAKKEQFRRKRKATTEYVKKQGVLGELAKEKKKKKTK